MPRQKWINKKNATTFTLVHRSQQDPLIYDAEASQMVFKEVAPSNQKIKTASDLESEYGSAIRSNEGEAAMYGVYYDDTEYDYMQHLRDIGESTEAVFIEAPQAESKQRGNNNNNNNNNNNSGGAGGGKGKAKQSLEDAIREDSEAKSNVVHVKLPSDVLPSMRKIDRNYQDQQDVPDVIKGFQPDMDPRLREVLTALEDEAYVEEDEEDFFSQLAGSGETTEQMFEDTLYDDDEDGEEDDDGWESDATEKAVERPQLQVGSELPEPEFVGADDLAVNSAESNSGWEREFARFKKDTKKAKRNNLLDDSSSIGGGRAGTALTNTSLGAAELCSLLDDRNNRKQKKKGVPHSSRMTATSGYSMSSSALHRTEGLTLLDDRFDRIEEEYAREDDDEDVRSQFTTSTMASMIEDERQDFNSILDEFLGDYSTKGKKHKRVQRGKQMSGLEQLDEIRKGLGPARIRTR